MNDESFAWAPEDERAICREHNARLLSPTGETLDTFLARCFAVYQATPVVIATPVVLAGKKVIEGWKR